MNSGEMWLKAIGEAKAAMAAHQRRIMMLRHSITSMREHVRRGDSWPVKRSTTAGNGLTPGAMTRDQLLGLLRDLETAVPPIEGTHHAIFRCQYGSDERGWEDRLAIRVSGPVIRNLFLEQSDFEKPRALLVADCVARVHEARK